MELPKEVRNCCVISDQFQIPVKYIGVGEKWKIYNYSMVKNFVDSFSKRN